MSDIKSWSTTAPQNNDAVPDGFPEGMAPSNVNDAAREIMASVRRQWNDAQWFNYGDGGKAGTYVFVASNQFKVISNPAADLTGEYHAGRRVKVEASTPGTIYGTITASSFFSPDTTVTVAFDSGSLANEALTVFLSVQRADDQGIPGTIVVDDGTAAAPSIRFRGDVDSGFFLKSAGEIGLSVGGVERMSFKDDGTFVGPKLGGWELLDSKVANNQLEIEFLNDFSDKYIHYCFALTGMHPVLINSNLRLRVTVDGGLSYLDSGYAYSAIVIASDNSGDVYQPLKSNGSSIYQCTVEVDADPKRGAQGYVYFQRPQITNTRPTFTAHIACEDGNAEYNTIIGGCRANTFDAVNGIKFFFGPSITNVKGGRIDLYGLRKP